MPPRSIVKSKESIVNSRHALVVAIGLSSAAIVSGCSQLTPRTENRASTGPLKSEPTAKLTTKQAADVQFALGRSLEDGGDPKEAEAAYRRAIKNDPKRADAHSRLAVVLCNKGEFKEAAKEFTAAHKCDPKNADILCDRGYAFYLQRRWADAESSFREALALNANHARSHNNLGLVFARQGEGDRAVSEFMRAGCDISDARANLGLILAMENQLPEAEKAYTEALANKPGSEVARQGLAALAKEREGRSGQLATSIPGRKDDAIVRTSAELPPLPSQ